MVVNFTELLGREYAGKLGEEADQFISYSVEGALRIEALLKALLAYWEVAEREQDSFASVDCGAVLAKALLNLQAAIAESGAMVTSDPLPTVVAEEVMLMQLFQNLISNSIKYRGEETPRIHVSAERDAEGWLFCGAGQRNRYRSARRRPGVRHVQTPAWKRNPRHGHRSGALQEDRRAPGWTDLGGIGSGARRYLQVHNSRPHRDRTAAR